jgi:flagellar protein FlaG
MASLGVRFGLDKETDRMIAKVVGVGSGELIRQMQSGEVVRMAKAMNNLTGLLFAKAV